MDKKHIIEMCEYIDNYKGIGFIDINTLQHFNYTIEEKEQAIKEYCNALLEEEILCDVQNKLI